MTNSAGPRDVIRVDPVTLASIIRRVRRAQPVGLVARTIPTMRRTDNPFHLGGGVFDLVRVRKLTGFIGFDYARCVNRQRGREHRAADFASQGRDWGVRDYGAARANDDGPPRRRRTPLIRHGSNWYLDLKRETVIRTEHQRITTGDVVDDDELEPFLRPADGRAERRRQRVDRPVIIRDYAIRNIAQITIDGTLYVMSPCPNTSLPMDRNRSGKSSPGRSRRTARCRAKAK